MWNGNITSTTLYNINEGLQQGAVTSPRLFIILTKGVLKINNVNVPGTKKFAIAYADDLVVYVADKDPSVVQTKLEEMVNNVNQYYTNWNLRINHKKCETILFHEPLRFISLARREKIKKFSINFNSSNNTQHKIEHKKIVKYLGLNIDYLCKLNNHIFIQLKRHHKLIRLTVVYFLIKILSLELKLYYTYY